MTAPLSHPLASGHPPPWASAWGESRYGPWAAFSVRSVEYRMQWIPPGTFQMGSPENEVGRRDNESQHTVTLTEGFWLGQTPCTQALWTAVMGTNPSRFEDPLRPVETVSWEEAEACIAKLNALRPGLDLRLPTEAQWEYACRAGTTAATYAGDLELVGANNAPVLDAIAWYGGNSGHGFDLAGGYDSSDWPEKQYPHTRAGTRRVGLRRPNPWGLHDMLGNVWEWCADGYESYGMGHAMDPIGPIKGSFRVLRGGSWFLVARGVRAAFRLWDRPGFRLDVVGFRFSRGQGAPGPGAGGQGAEPPRAERV